ncbi:glycosyltransferase family 2 protein [Vibrio splendidus]|uniref:glycosyltransferase family 2 protein n=1 Tax=Vibrio splendidus TaxID=29497 RepID=UPI0002DEC418|nr:glycosyltransferase family 2 protein [Vibrio splendidus]OEF82584.1 capsular biosynthesis protein [Vibrio splendidus 1F-157]PMJ51401.1 capsular biosynthesis protein [Vibrio splendidus]PTP73894.1 capsular biosynthesis protein [Vibrio splendidus]
MIVIPMAGLSSRFFKAGYTQPKYMLDAHGKSLFAHAVLSFKAYFESEVFVFIVRDVYESAYFVEQECEMLGIKAFKIVILDQETRGQAETVALGLEKAEVNKEVSLTVFNIDTFRPNFTFPQLDLLGEGYLEVFRGSGDNWSFAKPESETSTRVVLTTEKLPVSDLCSTGLYYFKNCHDFLFAYHKYIEKPVSEWEKGELYIAPLYNELIANNREVHYHLINREDVIFCGVPSEYDEFRK